MPADPNGGQVPVDRRRTRWNSSSPHSSSWTKRACEHGAPTAELLLDPGAPPPLPTVTPGEFSLGEAGTMGAVSAQFTPDGGRIVGRRPGYGWRDRNGPPIHRHRDRSSPRLVSDHVEPEVGHVQSGWHTGLRRLESSGHRHRGGRRRTGHLRGLRARRFQPGRDQDRRRRHGRWTRSRLLDSDRRTTGQSRSRPASRRWAWSSFPTGSASCSAPIGATR